MVRFVMCILASLGSFNKRCIETTIRLVYSNIEVIIYYVTVCYKASTRVAGLHSRQVIFTFSHRDIQSELKLKSGFIFMLIGYYWYFFGLSSVVVLSGPLTQPRDSILEKTLDRLFLPKFENFDRIPGFVAKQSLVISISFLNECSLK